jgi:hypothetical protein
MITQFHPTHQHPTNDTTWSVLILATNIYTDTDHVNLYGLMQSTVDSSVHRSQSVTRTGHGSKLSSHRLKNSDSNAYIAQHFDNYSHVYQYNKHERGLIKQLNLYILGRRVHRSIDLYLFIKIRFLCFSICFSLWYSYWVLCFECGSL